MNKYLVKVAEITTRKKKTSGKIKPAGKKVPLAKTKKVNMDSLKNQFFVAKGRSKAKKKVGQ